MDVINNKRPLSKFERSFANATKLAHQLIDDSGIIAILVIKYTNNYINRRVESEFKIKKRR